MASVRTFKDGTSKTQQDPRRGNYAINGNVFGTAVRAERRTARCLSNHLSMLITSRFAARPSANAWASPIFDASMSNMVAVAAQRSTLRVIPREASVLGENFRAEGAFEHKS